MQAIITILNGITETSMPLNEFVLYRASHYQDEKQILIICGSKQKHSKTKISENIDVKYTGKNPLEVRTAICQVIQNCRKQGISYIVHIHQLRSGFLSEIVMMGTDFRRKALFTVHSTFSGYKFYNKFFSYANALLAERITCVSNVSYQDYPKLVKQIKSSKMQVIQNGVDTERIDSILEGEKRIQNSEEINFIYVARQIPLKNHKFLVNVIKKCTTKIHFTFVGVEGDNNSISEKAISEGVADRIKFTGLILRNQVYRELQNADFYVSSSTLEGLPVSVLEAMYCGLPCILSDIPQHREIAGEDVVLLPFDEDKWVREINRMAELSVKEREEMSQRTKNYVEEKFSLSKMHEQYDAIYRMLY